MYFDALTLSAVVDELKATVLGGRIQEVIQVDELTLGLEVYSPPRRHYLVVSAHPQLARVHLLEEKIRRGVETASPLLLLLRKYVREARLLEIKQVPHERILWLALSHHEQGETALTIEIMGRHSNVILLDPGDVILESLKRVGADVNRYRVILPRQPYVPPPPQKKLAPEDLTELRLRDLIAAAAPRDPLWRALVAGIRGVSPLLAREWVYRAYGQAESPAGEVTRVGPLLEQFSRLAGPGSGWEPSVARQAGDVTAFAPYLLTHLGEPEPAPGISQAIALYVKAETSRDPYGAAKSRVKAMLDVAGKQLERKRQSLERSLVPGAEIEALRRAGELLLAYGYHMQPGQTSLKVDWEGTDEAGTTEIALDPTLSQMENAQKYFDRYSRARKAAQEVPALLGEVSLAEQYVDQLRTDLALAGNQPEIEEVRLALDEAGYLKPAAPQSGRRPKASRTKPLSVQSVDGLTIWVGKNSRQNDEVTFARATGRDLWLHARGVPGAHVIIRTEGRAVPESTQLQAAQLAAYFSASRANGHNVAVDCTEQRYVRRIKGAAPGLVTYSRETTLYVTPTGP